MLQLLGVPTWLNDSPDGTGQSGSPLPASLPAALLIYLACQGRWIEREALALLFWPDSPQKEARHNLRVNLHRTRQLLAPTGLEDQLESERTRVVLRLPTDLDLLQAACQNTDAAALLLHQPSRWLEGFRISGFESFDHWSQTLAARWSTQWNKAAQQALATANRQTPQPLWTDALRQAIETALDFNDNAPAQHNTASEEPANVQLLGRTPEIQALRSRQRAMLVTGEAGLGKTSLLAAALPQAPMLHGREGLEDIPYRPVAEYLQAHLGTLRNTLNASPDDLSAYRLDLARLLPTLAPKEPLPPLDMHTAKARLMEGLARVFEAWNPWLLVDDLQWCDAATLEFLTLLAHRGATRWRATARGYALHEKQRAWVTQLERAGHLQVLPLEGLGLASVQSLCKVLRSGQDWHAIDVQNLRDLSAGNPFFLQELLKSDRHGSLTALATDRRQLPERVRDMLQQRLHSLEPMARNLVEAAAVAVRPLPLAALAQIAGADNTSLQGPLLEPLRQALQSDLLKDGSSGLQCRHDLVRHAVVASLGAAHLQALHRRVALTLASRTERDTESLTIANHWSHAQEPQTALAWMFRGASQLKQRGRFDEAKSLWTKVAQESLDATQALQARLALAECELLTDLIGGRQALELILEQAPAVAEPLQRQHIEAQALAGLVDNLVFAGDMAAAQQAAQRLRPLLPKLRSEDRVHACEVLIELAMREPDIAGAWALLDQVRKLAPGSPSTLSFEGQIHWFAGQVIAARDAFETLLHDHADYCSGLTIENDLAVMLLALGDLPRAQIMARRSLVSWAEVPHTQALSLLVLGSVLTGMGQHAEALEALDRAEQLGQAQGSSLFEAEAQVRRAKLWLQCGHTDRAMADLTRAQPTLAGSRDPLRTSQYACARLLCQVAQGLRPEPELLENVQALTERSAHPLVFARLARMQLALAQAEGNRDAATRAACQQTDVARQAGMLEVLADGLLLQAELSPTPQAQWALLSEAAAIADRQGMAHNTWRAHRVLATHPLAKTQRAAHACAAHAALQVLSGEGDGPNDKTRDRVSFKADFV